MMEHYTKLYQKYASNPEKIAFFSEDAELVDDRLKNTLLITLTFFDIDNFVRKQAKNICKKQIGSFFNIFQTITKPLIGGLKKYSNHDIQISLETIIPQIIATPDIEKTLNFEAWAIFMLNAHLGLSWGFALQQPNISPSEIWATMNYLNENHPKIRLNNHYPTKFWEQNYEELDLIWDNQPLPVEISNANIKELLFVNKNTDISYFFSLISIKNLEKLKISLFSNCEDLKELPTNKKKLQHLDLSVYAVDILSILKKINSVADIEIFELTVFQGDTDYEIDWDEVFEELSYFKKLHTFSISLWKIKKPIIWNGLSKLKNLKELSLRSNKLKALPESLKTLKLLEKLDISDNNISEEGMEPILNLPNLKEVIIWHYCNSYSNNMTWMIALRNQQNVEIKG